MKKIIINQEGIELEVKPIDCPALRAIDRVLPVTSRVKVWGDEIYFDINVAAPAEGATIDVNVGDVAYWPESRCLCLFFGKTPMSVTNKPVPAGEVVIVGKTALNPESLRKVGPGSRIMVC